MNERLRTAMLRHGIGVEDLADECRVDTRTVERWMSTGRVPHRRHHGGTLFDHDATSFENVWATALPWLGTEV